MQTELQKQPKFSPSIIAWVIVLLVSILPNIIFTDLLHLDTSWMEWAKIGLLVVLVIVSWLWKPVQPLSNFFLILLIIFFLENLSSRVSSMAFWQHWFGGSRVPFTTSMLGIQLRRLVVGFLLIVILFLVGYKRKDFFLVRGKINAPMRPVKWLGFPKADPWTRFGGQFALYISLGTLAFLILGGKPTLSQLGQALPMLPMIFLFAIINSFYEELTYRGALLAPLEPALGYQNSLWITALFFGIGHFYGVPYGVVGVVMASFLGWLMGKSMLETRGFFWAWLIHFLQDVLIFSFMAMGSVVPGG